MLNRQEDWQKAFGEPSPALDVRIQQTLNHLEEEKPMKKATLRTALLVFALILALTGVVYAATNGWTLGDYFNQRYGDNVNTPKDFDSGFDQDYTLELEDLTFHIRDAYVEGGVLNAIVEISRTDGKPCLIRGVDCAEDDPICNLYVEMDPEKKESLQPVAEYARERGLPLYWAETGFLSASGRGDGSGDYWMEGDKTLAYFVSAEGVGTEGDHADFTWTVYTLDENGALLKKETPVTLPVEKQQAWDVAVDRQVRGLPVILDSIHLVEGRMGLYLDYFWHVDPALDKAMAEKIQRNDVNLWFRAVDPETGKELPGGPTVSGGVGSPDDQHFTQTGDSIAKDACGDTLYLQAFDAWEKTKYDVIEVKIK